MAAMAPLSEEWIYGIMPVVEALRARRREIFEIWMTGGFVNPRLGYIRSLAGCIPVHETTATELQRRAKGGRHQGVLARVAPLPLTDLDVLEREGLLLLLDGIQDPRNLGAIIRTSVAFGVAGIIFEKRRAASLSPVVAKAACGGLEHARLCRVSNLPMVIKRLKKCGHWVIGTREDGGVPLWEAEFPESVSLVVGAEGSGVRPIVDKSCDLWVSVPTSQAMRTLNASAAAAVVLYELMRFRKKNLTTK